MFGMVVFHECLKYTEEPRLKEVVIIEDRAQIAITSRYGQYPGFVKVIEQEQGAVVTRIVRPGNGAGPLPVDLVRFFIPVISDGARRDSRSDLLCDP